MAIKLTTYVVDFQPDVYQPTNEKIKINVKLTDETGTTHTSRQ